MNRIIVYVDDNTKKVIKNIIDHPYSPYKTFADFYRKAIREKILNSAEFMTIPYRPQVTEIPYEKPMTTGDIVDVFLETSLDGSLNARDICKHLGEEYNKRKKRFHSRMKELIDLNVVFKTGLVPTQITTNNGVLQTRNMNYYCLNYNNKYVKSRLELYGDGGSIVSK